MTHEHDLPKKQSADVSRMSAKIRQTPKQNTVHLVQDGISARGSCTPKYIVTTAHQTAQQHIWYRQCAFSLAVNSAVARQSGHS